MTLKPIPLLNPAQVPLGFLKAHSLRNVKKMRVRFRGGQEQAAKIKTLTLRRSHLRAPAVPRR
jgi:hypothetical protein